MAVPSTITVTVILSSNFTILLSLTKVLSGFPSSVCPCESSINECECVCPYVSALWYAGNIVLDLHSLLPNACWDKLQANVILNRISGLENEWMDGWMLTRLCGVLPPIISLLLFFFLAVLDQKHDLMGGYNSAWCCQKENKRMKWKQVLQRLDEPNAKTQQRFFVFKWQTSGAITPLKMYTNH